MSYSPFRMSLLTVALFVVSAGIHAADAPPASQIQVTVTEMCGGCVKGITARLQKVPEVNSLSCDVKSKKVTIVSKAGVTLSPKQLWEALEEAGKTPVKMITSTETFTAKPTK